MSLRTFLLFIIAFFSKENFAQTECLIILRDQVTNKPINHAAGILIHEKNGKLLGFNRTNGLGKTTIATHSLDSLKLLIFHPKYVSYTSKNVKCADTIRLYPQNKVIKEVIVKGNKAITMNGDTVSYIADSFKVPPGANVEDLLKKLPGLIVEKDGTIKANGLKVERVLVDGDDFFGNDATIATRNLDASMIDKVEVIDAESKRSQTTGETDDKVKIINLKLKNEAKKGYFGKTKQGYTNTDRYESTNMIHLFRDKLKLAGFLIADNIKANLDWQDREDLGIGGNWYYDEDLDTYTNSEDAGNFGQSYGVIPRSVKIGTNFSQKFDDATGSLGATYNMNSRDLEGNQINRSTLLYDTFKRSTENINSVNSNMQKHTINMFMEKRIDTLNKLYMYAKVNILNNNGRNTTNQSILNDSNLVNFSQKENPFTNHQETYDFNFEFDHKFKKKGRFSGISAKYTYVKNLNEALNIMNGQIYEGGLNPVIQTLNQSRQNYGNTSNLRLSTSYIEPLIKDKLSLEIDLSMLYNQQNSFNNTFNKNVINNQYLDLVSNLSNNYKYNLLALSQLVKLNYKSKKLDMNFGAKLQESSLIQDNLDSGDINLKRNFLFLLPNYRITWKYKRNSNLSFNFNTNVTPPSLEKLQPFTNNINPQNISVGNPNLIPTYNYNFSLRNSFWYPVSQTNLWSNFSVRIRENDIINKTEVKENGEVIESYEQVNGNYNLNGNINFGFVLKNLKINIDPGLSFRHNKSSQIINNSLNANYTNSLNAWLNISKSIDSLLQSDLSISMGASQSFSDNRSENNQSNYNINWDNALTLPLKFKLKTEIGWSLVPATNSFADNQSFVLLNAGIEKLLLKDNSLIIGLNAYDILNQNRTIFRNVYGNFINETINQAITRYIMFTINYKFKSTSKKQDNDKGEF